MSHEALDYLRVDDLLEIAASVVSHVAIRDAGLLASAVGRPQLTVYGEGAYPTFDEKAAALLHSLVRNHALVDGSRRLAWAATGTFCILSGRSWPTPLTTPRTSYWPPRLATSTGRRSLLAP